MKDTQDNEFKKKVKKCLDNLTDHGLITKIEISIKQFLDKYGDKFAIPMWEPKKIVNGV
jgi:hypothetical protein